MSKEDKKGLIPERRFPDFKDAGEWKNELFEKIYSFKTTNSLSRDKLNYKQGTVKNIHYGDIHTKFSTLFDIEKEIVPYINPTESLERIKPDSYCVEGDMIFADASEDMDDIGKSIEIFSLNNEKLVSGLHTLLARQIKKKLVTGFGGYLFKSNRIREQIKKESQGAKVLGLSGGRLSSISVVYPADEKEQKKIADCLTSIAELITAQTQKLNALKTHKKGLMQQLFPAEGETVPRLRFPEFRDKGGWEEKRLGDVGSVRMCKRIFKEQTSPRGDIPFYKIGTFGGVPDAYISREIFDNYRNNFAFPKNGAVLISAAGTIGRAVVYKGELAYFQDSNIVWLDNNENLITDNFLFYLYQLIKWAPSVGAIQRLYNENILGAQVKFPSIPEQQKIADCLTYLDDLIIAQTQKVEAVKTHKKGLMQQLFPAINEVDA